jgi:hypothetical protein
VQVEELPNAGEFTAYMKWNKPLPMPQITIMNAEEAKTMSCKRRSNITRREMLLIQELLNRLRTGKIDFDPNVPLPSTQFKHRRLPIDSYKIGIITDPAQVGGYPDYKGAPYKDSDNDGMPDDWKRKMV